MDVVVIKHQRAARNSLDSGELQSRVGCVPPFAKDKGEAGGEGERKGEGMGEGGTFGLGSRPD